MTVGPAVMVALAIAILGARVRPLPTRVPVARRRRRNRRIVGWLPWPRTRSGPSDADVAAWCGRVARSTRAGRSLTAALAEADRETAIDSRPFPGVSHALGRGRPLAEALATEHADPSTAVGVAGPVLCACADVGGPPGPPLERVASTLLARVAERDERVAGTAQARLSARVLTAVPFGVLALLAATEPAIRAALATPAGVACLTAGVILNLLGRWWMGAIIGASS